LKAYYFELFDSVQADSITLNPIQAAEALAAIQRYMDNGELSHCLDWDNEEQQTWILYFEHDDLILDQDDLLHVEQALFERVRLATN
jgi:hypothetical protein